MSNKVAWELRHGNQLPEGGARGRATGEQGRGKQKNKGGAEYPLVFMS
jgi:hypothetical protein